MKKFLILLFIAGVLIGLLICTSVPAQPVDAQPTREITTTTTQTTMGSWSTTSTTTPAPSYTEEELEILALIIYQEAGSDLCSDETRQMVGEVFLNRVASPYYPDTFYDVATQHAQYGYLSWTGLQWPDRATSPYEEHAVARAYATARALLEESVERLLPADAIYQAEFEQGTETLAEIDSLYFCR